MCQAKLKSNHFMLVFYNYYHIKLFFPPIINILIFLSVLPVTCFAQKLLFDDLTKIIIIDPGHGGHDKGVVGTNNTMEKTITLKTARVLEKKLQNKYTTYLTRTDNFGLTLKARAGIANNLKGNLFISIHTGGSSIHTVAGMTIFYLTENESNNSIETSLAKRLTENNQITWNNIQKQHISLSKTLAKSIQTHLNSKTEHALCKIQNANLLLLKGLDMPAILIEIGYLTNPFDENKMNDSKTLSDIVDRIVKGIDFFFNKNSAFSLHK